MSIPGIYDTQTLVGVIQTLPPVPSYWLDLLFPSEQTFETEYIDFDMINYGRRMAPFVSPNVQGRVMKSQGYETKRFSPAYVKPKHAVRPDRAIKRAIGEQINGSMSPEERYMAAVAQNLAEERRQIMRRWEWMATQAVLTGMVTVEGDDYPSSTLDFGRDPGQTITKTSGTFWGDSGVKIGDDIDAWMTQTQILTGFAPTRLTMSPDVWPIFKNDEGVKAALSTISRGTQSSLEIGVGTGMPSQYKGTYGASLEIYTYNDVYEDNTGAKVNMMPAGTVVLSSPAVEGVRAFGAIMDRGAQFMPYSIFPKMYEEEDPSVTWTLSQSAPLMIPSRPDAVLVAKVK